MRRSINADSYSLLNKIAAPSTNISISPAARLLSCWEGSAANGIRRCRHSWVWFTIARGVVGADDHQVDSTDPVERRPQLDLTCFGHRPRVERGDLVLAASVVHTNRAV